MALYLLMLMKKLTTVVILFVSMMSFSQTENITNILNNALQNEIRLQSQQYTEIDTLGNVVGYHQMVDTIVVVKPFEIQNNVLSFTVQRNLNDGRYVIEKQEVPLDKIKNVSKDIGVFLDTLSEDVIITSTLYLEDGTTTTSEYNYHFLRTYCVTEKQNEYLGDELVKAFKEAGYPITVSHWYD